MLCLELRHILRHGCYDGSGVYVIGVNRIVSAYELLAEKQQARSELLVLYVDVLPETQVMLVNEFLADKILAGAAEQVVGAHELIACDGVTERCSAAGLD